jgi:hypothetical protein
MLNFSGGPAVNVFDWITVAVTITFSQLCAKYAEDLKKFIDGRVRNYHHRIKKSLEKLDNAESN